MLVANLFTSNSLAGDVLFQPKSKQIAPVVAAGLIGAGASFLGNIFGKKNQDSANATNLKIAQMNNEFNERMFDKQIQNNWDMWNAENEYNSAVNQRARLEDAGLNPYLMMNGGSAGIGNGSSATTPPTAQSVHVDAFKPDFSGVVESALQYGQQEFLRDKVSAETRALNSQTTNQDIKNEFERELLKYELINRVHLSHYTQEQAHGKSLENQFALKSFDTRMQQLLIQNELNLASKDEVLSRANLNTIQAKMIDEQIKWITPQALANINELATRASMNIAAGTAYRASAQQSIANAIESAARTDGIIFDNGRKAVDTYNYLKLAGIVLDAVGQNENLLYGSMVEELKSSKSASKLLDYRNRRDLETESEYKGLGAGMRFYKSNSPISFGVHN